MRALTIQKTFRVLQRLEKIESQAALGKLSWPALNTGTEESRTAVLVILDLLK